MTSPALSSADAMIVNMFFGSKFEVIASSDVDIAHAVLSNKTSGKHAVVPDEVKSALTE